MDIENLFHGVAVVIDDDVHNSDRNISRIISQIESKNIPILKYTSLPDLDIVNHFSNLSFLLLDWRMDHGVTTNQDEEIYSFGVTAPAGLIEHEENRNIDFIKRLNEKCFFPIFLFTNENPEIIKEKLISESVINPEKKSNIFIKSKSDLQRDGSLFETISEWIKSTPSIYVLKEWELEYQRCKTKLFSELHKINASWPNVMWKNFSADEANESLEMGELISRNLHSRMTPFSFNEELLSGDSDVPRDELRKILEGERFLKKESLHENNIGTGDLFKKIIHKDGVDTTCYYLNIRAQCDLLRVEDPTLFVIAGYKLVQNERGKITDISFNNGQYLEKAHHAVIAFLDDGAILEFKFSEFDLMKWSDLKSSRIGRLLPPYISRVQQRYALYMHRHGLPRIPDEAIK